jgi:hypothetical protein
LPFVDARTEHDDDAGPTRIWLERVHQVRVTAQTIQRVFRGRPHSAAASPSRRCLSSTGQEKRNPEFNAGRNVAASAGLCFSGVQQSEEYEE